MSLVDRKRSSYNCHICDFFFWMDDEGVLMSGNILRTYRKVQRIDVELGICESERLGQLNRKESRLSLEGD